MYNVPFARNPGFKAPIVMLNFYHGLTVGKDYDCTFSTSHDVSIRMVVEGEAAVATFASDMLDRLLSETSPRTSFNEIYSSEKYPAAALGLA